jgi:benzoyl-CoA 2,3-dioxygenase component B
MFTDRDGKYQLLSLAESGFDPLARSCRFMLTEEAHHMFVGQTGIARVVRRTCEVMNEHPDACPSEHGAIPLEMIQRYINFWAASSLDLFGAEVSSNSANFFAAGLKGRAYEDKYEDHLVKDDCYELERWDGERITREQVPLRNAMNEVLRDGYVDENLKGVEYWNRECEKAGIDFRFAYPHRRFNRTIGEFAGARFDPQGNAVSQADWQAGQRVWLPTPEDKAYVKSLMRPVTEPGKFAGWIAPPLRGINSQAADFEYVKL